MHIIATTTPSLRVHSQPVRIQWMYTVNKKGNIRKHHCLQSLSSCMDGLYIRKEGGFWTGIGYSSQVDDVAVQDLLISNEKCKKTITCLRYCTYHQKYIN